jgi:PAS domain S-box-containing protein
MRASPMQHQLLIEIVDRAADFIAMADAEGRLTYLNPSGRAMVGMPEGQDPSATHLSDYHPSWVVKLLQSTGLAEARRAGTWSGETALMHRDGREIPVSQTIVAHRTPGGRLRGYSTIARDMSDRRSHEAERQQLIDALWRSEAQFRRAQAMAHVGSYELTIPYCGQDYWSEEVYQILGLDPSLDALAAEDAIRPFIHPDDRPFVDEARAQVIRHGRSYSIEFRIVRADGTVRTIYSLGGPVRDRDGAVVKLAGTLQDVTGRKHTEKALQNLAGHLINAQEEERSRIGRELHDHISQRLSVVAIKLDHLRADSGARASGVSDRLDELLRHTNEILDDVHRLSHRLHSATLHDLGLVPAIQRLARDFEDHRHIKVECTFSSIPGRLPQAVALCLLRIAEEALNNVAKHSDATSAQVHLAHNADGLHLVIADTGAGFDSKDVEHQAGLGFVSMRERCRLIDANMLVHSEPGRGTTIGVWVPSKSLRSNAAPDNEAPPDRAMGLSRDGG